MAPPRRLRIAHLFPDLLRFYGDGGNVGTLTRRATARSIEVEVLPVPVGTERLPTADLIFVGGGQDREQVTVAHELERLGPQVRDQVADGAALLGVCGGYQNLGISYRTSLGAELPCPGLLPVTTDGSVGGRRLVGSVLAEVDAALFADAAGTPASARALDRTVIGFENHAGRTVLEPGARLFARIEIGHGNNDRDGGEGVLLLPGEGGSGGLRIGTYLHGPLLPRNPHIADALIAAAVARGGVSPVLAPLDDDLDWMAHDAACARLRRSVRAEDRWPAWAHRVVDPIRSLIGY